MAKRAAAPPKPPSLRLKKSQIIHRKVTTWTEEDERLAAIDPEFVDGRQDLIEPPTYILPIDRIADAIADAIIYIVLYIWECLIWGDPDQDRRNTNEPNDQDYVDDRST